MLKPLADNLLLIVATYAAAKTYIYDLGPGNIFMSSYQFFSNRADSNRFASFMSDALACMKCMSFWTALILILIRAVSRPLFLAIAVPLAVSGITISVEDSANKIHIAIRNLTAR